MKIQGLFFVHPVLLRASQTFAFKVLPYLHLSECKRRVGRLQRDTFILT